MDARQVVPTPSPSGSTRFLVGLSWDDAALASPAKIYNPRVTRDIPQPVNGFLRHLIVWIQEMFWTTGRSVKTGYRTYRSNKADDQDGRDLNYAGRDLDLLCLIYDADKNFVRSVGPETDQLIDPAGVVYHSGEEHSGAGAYDDEIIRIEVDRLPRQYQHFVFLTLADSKLSLGRCGPFSIRLADSMSNADFLKAEIQPEQGGDHTAHVFCHLYRENDKWFAKSLNLFGEFETDWATHLKTQL